MSATTPGMIWGVKESLRRYIREMPDGSIDLDGKAESFEERYFFPLGAASSFDAESGVGILEFTGGLVMRAHDDVLYVSLADPILEMRADGARLTVRVGRTRRARIELAMCTSYSREIRDGGTRLLMDAPLLTGDGASLFEFQYDARTRLDPIEVRLG